MRLHAAQCTSLEHPGLASLGTHALKLLTFPNLFPSLLIGMKNWTQPPTLKGYVVNLDLTPFLLSLLSFTLLPENGTQRRALVLADSTANDEGHENRLYLISTDLRDKIIPYNKQLLVVVQNKLKISDKAVIMYRKSQHVLICTYFNSVSINRTWDTLYEQCIQCLSFNS